MRALLTNLGRRKAPSLNARDARPALIPTALHALGPAFSSDPDEIPLEDVKRFAKNAGTLAVLRYQSLRNEWVETGVRERGTLGTQRVRSADRAAAKPCTDRIPDLYACDTQRRSWRRRPTAISCSTCSCAPCGALKRATAARQVRAGAATAQFPRRLHADRRAVPLLPCDCAGRHDSDVAGDVALLHHEVIEVCGHLGVPPTAIPEAYIREM